MLGRTADTGQEPKLYCCARGWDGRYRLLRRPMSCCTVADHSQWSVAVLMSACVCAHVREQCCSTHCGHT
eukprot:11558381-Alexandrium_andersonii.AAC.1